MKKIPALYLVWLGRYPISNETTIYYGGLNTILTNDTYIHEHVSFWLYEQLRRLYVKPAWFSNKLNVRDIVIYFFIFIEDEFVNDNSDH